MSKTLQGQVLSAIHVAGYPIIYNNNNNCCYYYYC